MSNKGSASANQGNCNHGHISHSEGSINIKVDDNSFKKTPKHSIKKTMLEFFGIDLDDDTPRFLRR